MGELRKPFFIAAVALILIAVATEIGATWFLGGITAKANALTNVVNDSAFADYKSEINTADLDKLNKGTPPGRAIPAMALLDGLVLFTVLLMGAPLFIPERIFAKVQGVATLVVSLLALIGSIMGIFLAFALLILMIALFTAFPFGTIATQSLMPTACSAPASISAAFVSWSSLKEMCSSSAFEFLVR
jgi:hypothetical protein